MTEIYFLTVLEAGSLRSRCQQDWFLQGLSFWLAGAVFSLCPHNVALRARVCVLISSNYGDTSPTGLVLTLVTSFYFNYLHKCPISKQSHDDILGVGL